MKLKKEVLIALTASVLLLASSDMSAKERALYQSSCALIDQSRPAQFVSYDGPSDSGKGITLRIHNNTNCIIIVETDDRSPTLLPRLPKGGVGVEPPTNPQDDARLDLHYFVQDRQRWRALRPAYGWGDSVFTFEIQGGHSASFVVPARQLKQWFAIAVPFKYSWEKDTAIAAGVGGVVHRVYFLVDDLPPAVLRHKE